MKKTGIFTIFSTLAFAFASAFALGADLSSKNADVVDAVATSESATIYFSWSGSWGVDPYVSYCVGEDNWTHMSTMCGTSGSSGLGSVNVPANTTKVIFAHRSGDASSWWGQTSDMDIVIDATNGFKNQLTITSNSSSFGASWGYYTGVSNTIIYNNNGGSGTIANQQIWLDNATLSGGSGFSKDGYVLTSWNTKADGTGKSYSVGGSATYKNFPNYVNGSNVTLYAQWEVDLRARYIIGDFGTCDWGLSGAVKMTYNEAKGQWEGSVNLAYQDEFKVAYYNQREFEGYKGYSDILTSCGAFFCFDSNGGNIRVWASGTYNIYYKDATFGDNKYLSIEIDGGNWNAEQLAAKLMSFGDPTPGQDGPRTCGDYFYDMRDKYVDELSASEKTKFQGFASSGTAQFKNAYDRYVAWAAALGQDPWTKGASGGARLISASSNDTNNIIPIIVIVSLISVTSIGGFFFIKKRKED